MKNILSLILLLVCCDGFAATKSYTLQQLLDSARQNNITLRNARRGIEAAQEQRKEAFTKYFPNVSATGMWFNANKGMAETTITPSEVIPAELGASMANSMPTEMLASLGTPINISMMKNGTIAGVSAVQPVFAGGQIAYGNKLAKVGEEAADLQLKLSENEVEKTAEQYYWQLVTLQEKLKTVGAVKTMLADIHKDVEVAVRAGVAIPNDLLQVELRQNDTKSQQLKLQNNLSIIKLLMAQYCGLRDTSFVVQQNTSTTNSCQTESAEENALFNVQLLPEYQLLDKQVEAAKLQKRIAVGEQLPSVAVGAGYNYHNLMDKNHSFAMVFATVSVPLSGWWGGSHAIKRKKIEYQKAIDEQRDKSEQLQIRMQNAKNCVTEARLQLDITQHSIKQAKENLRLNRDFYRAGTSKMSDLLEAQLLYQQAMDHHTDAIANYQLKLLDYRQAIGE